MRDALAGIVVSMALAQGAWAHPGRTDGCRGHLVQQPYQYVGCHERAETIEADCPESPAGEYHFHVTGRQMEEDVLPSLAIDRRDRVTVDDGRFTIGERAYVILRYTPKGVAIVRCEEAAGHVHEGPMRIE